MNPITSCHGVPAIVAGGDEGTNHYECPVCHQSVNIDGSNPNQHDPFKPDENYQVHDENAEIALKEVGQILDKAMPEGYGFVFLMTTYGKGGNTFYISNVQRPDVIEMMKEWIENNKGKI
jgi:hypothetical protein